jgi:transcriptional regulator with XRE-family HTH domain
MSLESAELRLAQRIVALRLKKNRTQEVIASRSGLSLATYRRFEKTGRGTITALSNILNAIGRPADLEAVAKVEADFEAAWDAAEAPAKPPRRRATAKKSTKGPVR